MTASSTLPVMDGVTVIIQHARAHTHTHTHTHTQPHRWGLEGRMTVIKFSTHTIHKFAHTVQTLTPINKHTHTHTHTHTHRERHTHTRMDTHTDTDIHTHTHTHRDTNTHTLRGTFS